MDRRIFLSYRHDLTQDLEGFVADFERSLAEHLFSTWRDDKLQHGHSLSLTIDRALSQSSLALVFLCSAAATALRDTLSGFHKEVRQIIEWTRSPTKSNDCRVVIVDLVDYSDDQIAELPLIDVLRDAYRLKANDAFAAHLAGDRRGTIRNLIRKTVRELISQTMGGGVRVYPRLAETSGQSYYALSWIGGHGLDTVSAQMVPDEFEAYEETPRIPMRVVKGQHILQIRFDHNPRSAEDYWAAAIGFDRDRDLNSQTKGRWLPVDTRKYGALSLEVRGEPARLPLYVRVEDNSTASHGPSQHQSSSWNQRPVLLSERFQLESFNLQRDLQWDAGAYLGNTAPVNRQTILQLTLGYDQNMPSPIQGLIEIRSIWLRLT